MGHTFVSSMTSYIQLTVNVLLISVRMCDIHCEPKSYKVKLLEKLVIQHGIRACLAGGCLFKPHYMFISQFIKPKKCYFISPIH